MRLRSHGCNPYVAVLLMWLSASVATGNAAIRLQERHISDVAEAEPIGTECQRAEGLYRTSTPHSTTVNPRRCGGGTRSGASTAMGLLSGVKSMKTRMTVSGAGSIRSG